MKVWVLSRCDEVSAYPQKVFADKGKAVAERKAIQDAADADKEHVRDRFMLDECEFEQ